MIKKHRAGFSMITAIFVMAVMATVALLVFNLSGKITKTTAIQYRTEQAALLARSYTELAIMAVMEHNRTATGDCVENIDGVVNSIVPGETPSSSTLGYTVQTRIYYIGNSLPCNSTRILNSTPLTTDYSSAGSFPDALAAIVVDVYVSYKDPGADNPSSAPDITYHRRTLQKI